MDSASANDYLATSGPSNYEQPLPPMVRANAVIEVAPAKKITFFKSGDPQFSGVKMAINRRSFKSINTLMDDLSSRVPLPFGVRTITTPRGTRCVSRLDQLEDGGCYLCSDKKYVQPFSAGHPGRRMVPQRAGNSISTQRPVPPEGPREEYSVAHSHPALKIRKKITLVKNMDPTVRRLIIVNRRNARNFKTFLEDVSDLLQCTVKKLYTLDGKRIDSMQTVLHSPNVLVCVGREPFKPILTENVRMSPSEQLPGLSSRSQPSIVSESTDSKKNVSFGLKAKKSVIHPRSASSNRTRFSLSSEKSYANGLNMSPMNSRCASFSKPKEGDPAHSLMNDDIEKRVHVNKDGSLSVEMKVRFRLLNDETLQWSTQIKKSRAVKKDNGDPLCVYEEEDRTECRQANNPETFSETDDSFYPCDADSYSSKPNEAEDEDAYCNNCGKQCQDYDIWKNPIHASHPIDAGMRNTWCARSSGSSTSSHRRVMRKQKTSVESIRTTSSEEYTEHFVQQSSCYSKVVESCNSQMDCCIANHCTSRNSRSTATSSVEPVEEMDMVHSDTNPRRSPASEASISNTQNTIDCQESVELPNQGSDSNLQTCCSGCVEPSGAQKSGNMTNMTNHDRQDSNISESALRSRKSKKNLHKTYSTHSKSLSSNHSLSKTDMNEGSRCPPSGNSICSIKEDCCDCDKNSIIKEDCSSISTHKEGTLTSVSVKTMSESERWSTEGSNQSKGSEKERDIQVEESDGICSTEQNERVQQQQCQMHTLTIDSTAMLTTGTTEDLCESKTNMYESSSQHSELIPVSVASTPDISTGNKRPHSGSSTDEKCGNRIKFSSGSDLCVSNLTDIKESNDVSFGSLISRQSSKSESFGSKYDCISNPGIERLQSTSSGVSSNSEPKSEAAEAGSMSEDVLSKYSIAHSSDRAKRKKETIRAKPENCDRASDSKTASLTSIHSPSPPNGKPRNKSRSSKLKHSSTGSRQKEPAHIVEDLRECPDNSRPSTSPSKPITSKVNTENENNTTTGKDIQNSEQNMHKARRKSSASSSKKKAKVEVGVARTLIGGTREIIPSALPNISAEEVVHEWLKNIPSETLVVEYGETLVVEYGAEHEITDEATKEALNCESSQVAQSAEELFGKDATTKTHSSDPMTEGISSLETSTTNTENKLKAEEIITQENYNDSLLECMRTNQEERELSGFVPHRNSIKNVLPRKVHASVQIMKALFSSPHATTFDRSNSLPEVSPTMGQKLSNSAKVLITCLAGLKLLDEETMDPMDKLGGVNHNRYIELMNVFQALWIEGPVDVDRLNVARSTKQKSTMTSDSHRNCSRDAEPTPASSSGVDVNSGSGGSGDGSMHGNGDSTLTNEKAGDCKAIFVDTKTENTIKAHHEPDVASTPEQDKKDQCCSQSSYSLTDKVREETESNEGSSRTSSQNISTDNITSCGAHCNDNETNDVDENMNETIMDNIRSHLDETSLERDTVTASPGEDNDKCEKDCPVSNDGADNAVNLGSNEEQKIDPNISGSQGTIESNSESDCQSTVYFISESNENNGSVVNRESFITDPVWILKLLKKIEKEFMTHYVDAMNEFKVRWNLEENDNLNEMIAELKSEVEKRIQKSVEKELAKIQGRAGNTFPRPPNKMSRQRPTQQTEQRRQRLQTMRKKSLFNDLNMAQNRQIVSNDISLETDEEDLTFSASLADEISADDDFCPCETCIRKKLALRTLRPNTLASNAPIVRAFDLREILRMKKDVTPLSANNSDTDYQHSLALQNGHADNNGNETYSTDHGDLDNTGANKTLTSEHSEQDKNEKFKENEFQQNEQASDLQADEKTIANFSHVNEKGENDLNQGKEENTVEENQEAVENKSQHESDHETDVEVADNEGTEDDNKEGGEDLVTAEQISEEEITEVGDCTDPCIEDDQDMKENGPGEPEGDSEMELAESEKKDLDLEDADLESELCENEGNEENHLLTYTAALSCDSDSHNDCHEQIEGDAEERVESTVDKKDGDAAVETGGSQPEELDVIPKEDLNDSQIVEVGGNEECDADQNEDMAGSSNENMEECKAEELDLSPKEDMDDRTAEESNDIPASDIDENRAEDKEHGQIDSIGGGPPEDLATYTVEANVSKSEEGEPPEENDGHPTLDIEECTTVETCRVLVEEEDGGTLEKEDVTPIQEQENYPVKEFNGGPEEEEDGHLTEENNGGPAEEEDGGAAEEKEEENSCPSKENNEDAEKEDDSPGESDCLLAGDVDSGTVEKEEHDGLTEEINGGRTEEIDGSIVEEDSVPPEDINDDPSEDMNGDAAEEADAGPQEETNGRVTDVMEGGAEKEDDAVPPENINDSQTEDMNRGSVENKDAVPEDDNNSDPAEDVAGGAAEEDAGPLEEINGGSAEDIDGGEEEENDGGLVEDINGEQAKEDAGPGVEINGAQEEDMGGDIKEENEGGVAEDIKGEQAGASEQTDVSPVDDMPGDTEQDTNTVCQDLDTVNGNTAHGDSDTSDSKPAQMYPDSSSEEEDRNSTCTSPVASNNRSLKKSNELHKQSIELDDLDF